MKIEYHLPYFVFILARVCCFVRLPRAYLTFAQFALGGNKQYEYENNMRVLHSTIRTFCTYVMYVVKQLTIKAIAPMMIASLYDARVDKFKYAMMVVSGRLHTLDLC